MRLHSMARGTLPHRRVPVGPILSRLPLLAAGVAAGALAMFFFDSISGRRRRALVRDKVVGAGHGTAGAVQTQGKRAIDHLKGFFFTRRLDRVTRSEPQSDQQLHDRIRARLGRIVSHPKSVHVEVNHRHVSLTGHILTKELRKLIDEVRHQVGVRSVEHRLACHDSAQGIPELQGRGEPSGREQQQQRRETVS
jgi:hypothetical protein